MNFSSMKNYKRLVASIGLATMLTVAVAAPAFAADTVTGEVTGGALTAVVADADLGSTAYSHAATFLTGALDLNANDQRGTGAGWSVTIAAGEFAGATTSDTIAGANLSITTYGVQTVNAGQAEPAPVAGSTGSLGGPVTVLSAAAGSGQGDYTQMINVNLDVDAGTLADNYTSTLSVLTAAAPI